MVSSQRCCWSTVRRECGHYGFTCCMIDIFKVVNKWRWFSQSLEKLGIFWNWDGRVNCTTWPLAHGRGGTPWCEIVALSLTRLPFSGQPTNQLYQQPAGFEPASPQCPIAVCWGQSLTLFWSSLYIREAPAKKKRVNLGIAQKGGGGGRNACPNCLWQFFSEYKPLLRHLIFIIVHRYH